VNQYDKEKLYWPYYFQEHQPDIVHLRHRCCCHWDQVRLVSVWETDDTNREENHGSELTLLFWKALDRWWAPSSPMLLLLRLSEISVYLRNWRYKQGRKSRIRTHFVILESIGQVVSSFFSNSIVIEIDCSQCLCQQGTMQTWESRKEAYSPYYIEKHRIDDEHLFLRLRSL
jgi:hypothetical protein